jgi:fructose-1,6-bisphosphatase/inositol monophosphatase family enzyme
VSTSSNFGASSKESPEELHEFVCDLALRAGELQLSRYERPGEITEKAPKDLVTEVDLLSEEQGGEISATGRTWFLDPVDGTANFSRANPLFCSCVSVAEDNRITHAAVAAPRLGDLYHASLGGGAHRDNAGERTALRVRETERLEDAFVGADVSFIGGKNDEKSGGLREVFASCWQLRALGSAGIRGAWLAAGYLDVSIGTRHTAWDYAPTALMVAEAGGRVTDLSGNPWTYDSDGLIAANPILHDEIMELLARSG